MSENATLSKSQFADYLGVTPPYVTKLIKLDRLVLDASGRRVRVQESLQRLEATKDPNRDDVVDRWKRAREAKDDKTTEERQDQGERVIHSFSDARAKKEHYLALKAQTDYEQMIGNLCTVESVRAAGVEIGTVVRTKAEAMPDQLSAELAIETDEARVHALMVEYVELMLGDIAETIGKAMDHLSD